MKSYQSHDIDEPFIREYSNMKGEDMSGIYPTLLRRRAESMIKIAERLLGEGEYDLAVFNAEYATQLYIESLLYRLS